jgi:hypothetical protein
MKNIKYKTVRLDHVNRTENGGYRMVSENRYNFSNPEQIYEVHVWSINENDLIEIQKGLPKNMQRKIGSLSGHEVEQGTKILIFRFNTLFPTKVTGQFNETAINGRKRILKHLSEKLNISHEK